MKEIDCNVKRMGAYSEFVDASVYSGVNDIKLSFPARSSGCPDIPWNSCLLIPEIPESERFANNLIILNGCSEVSCDN